MRLYCLGRFEIVHQGRAIDLGKKPPKKTLALMRLLASRNGQEITIFFPPHLYASIWG